MGPIMLHITDNMVTCFATPLIPTSARRAMAKQGVCRAATERLLSAHWAISLGGCSPSAQQTPCPPLLAERSWGSGISGVQRYDRKSHMITWFVTSRSCSLSWIWVACCKSASLKICCCHTKMEWGRGGTPDNHFGMTPTIQYNLWRLRWQIYSQCHTKKNQLF